MIKILMVSWMNVTKDNLCDECEWEVSDFMSSEDSCNEWLP